MISFICPVCGLPLEDRGSLYCCKNRHSFDKSRYGYVNLLLSNQSSKKHHGDDRLMVRARKDFLSKGYYGFLLSRLSELCRSYLNPNACILDAGCGECYYSCGILDDNPGFDFAGIDISKDALEYAAKRGAEFPLAVAGVFDMPFADNSFDCVINCFSPNAEKEYARVLKSGGILLRVVPLEDHLFSLKAVIYDKPYLNEKPQNDISLLKLSDYTEIRKTLIIENKEDINNLFKMTPYYYKTGAEDQNKVLDISRLETEAAFGIFIYTKEKE